MPQTGAYGAVQQNWRATSRQPIEVIVELTVNNLVLFIKKLECRSQLGRVSAKSEPYCPTPSSLFSRSMQYTLIGLTLFHEWNGRSVSKRMRNAKVMDKRPTLQPIKSGVSLLAKRIVGNSPAEQNSPTKSHIWRWNRGFKPAASNSVRVSCILGCRPFFLGFLPLPLLRLRNI